MLVFAIALNILAILGLFGLLFYVASKTPSKLQSLLILLLISTIIVLFGYVIEIESLEKQYLAVFGAFLSYLGKPFAVLLSYLLIAEYCKKYPPKWLVAFLSSISLFFTIVVFTNPVHNQFYSYISFDKNKMFSKLVMGHGPLYYAYMVYMILTFVISLILIVKEYKKCNNKESKEQVLILFAMFISIILGYLVYLMNITYGYDTTMIGAIVSVVLLAVLFFKYRLFDYLLYAKNKALDESSEGILVLNERNETTYSNLTLSRLIKYGVFTEKELVEANDGKTNIYKEDKVYQLNKSSVEDQGTLYGKVIEVSDITTQYHYTTQLQNEVALQTKQIRKIQESIIFSFSELVEARDNSTGQHIKRMSKIVQLLGEELQKNGDYPDTITHEYITILYKVAPLHDVGKISISDTILLKPGALTKEEFEIIKTHTTRGAEIIDSCFNGLETPIYVRTAKEIAKSHHEKWDGTGYPLGLKGEEIPLAARIVALADVYDAISSERCYKKAFSKDECRKIILESSGTHFDPVIVDAFERILPEIEGIAFDNLDLS